jgi:hypothetical protein
MPKTYQQQLEEHIQQLEEALAVAQRQLEFQSNLNFYVTEIQTSYYQSIVSNIQNTIHLRASLTFEEFSSSAVELKNLMGKKVCLHILKD